MLLTKEIVVNLDLVGCKLRQYTSKLLRDNGIDLTSEQFLALDILWNKGPVSQKVIAQEMQKDKNSVTKLVDALQEKGYVLRQQDPIDRRSNIVVPTKKANDMKFSTKQFGINMLDKILEDISEEELQSCLATLKKLDSAMR